MAWLAPVLAGVGALGGLFGNRPQTTRQTQNQQAGSNFNTTSAQGVTPQLDPLAAQGYNAISDKFMQLINTDPNLSGYYGQQANQIDKLSQIQSQNTSENLASKGIFGPAAATAQNNVEANRISNLAQLNQQIPLLARQLQEQTLNNALPVYKGIPVGSYSTGGSVGGSGQWSSGQGTNTSPGNQLGGAFGGLGDILALLFGMGGNKGGGGNLESVGAP